MEKIWKEKIASLQAEADTFITKIETMKIERKKRSATLQRKLFEQFQILNAHGETKDLCRIFAQTIQKFPPAFYLDKLNPFCSKIVYAFCMVLGLMASSVASARTEGI